ncbi:MAG: MoaD/ThiS family protein [Methanobacteriota archaeon]
MKVTVKTDKKSMVEIRDRATINDLLEQLGINRETVIVRRNKEICLEEELLKPNDFVEIIKVVTGG